MKSNQPMTVIAKGIVKHFGKHTVLDDIDFEMPANAIYGISGPNGAGKSVFLRILTGLILPDAGTVEVFGEQIGKDIEFPYATGALIDQPGFLPYMSGKQNLMALAKIRGVITPAEIEDSMRFFGLNPADPKPVGKYSNGMRQRLGLVQAVMEDPQLLILDEPTNGLDAEGQREIYHHLVEIRKQGKSILITSHSTDEIKILCDRAFILRSGKLHEDLLIRKALTQ